MDYIIYSSSIPGNTVRNVGVLIVLPHTINFYAVLISTMCSQLELLNDVTCSLF